MTAMAACTVCHLKSIMLVYISTANKLIFNILELNIMFNYNIFYSRPFATSNLFLLFKLYRN